MNREIEKIFKGLARRFNKDHVRAERTYHFELGADESWTVRLTRESCHIARGDGEGADVYFKGPAQLFLDVWNGRHELGPKDFFTGKVKSNNPLALRDFVAAFRAGDRQP